MSGGTRRIFTNLSENASAFQSNYHSNIINEISEAVKDNQVVVIGMAYNPFCSKVQKALTEQGVKFRYIEYGSYFSMWKERLAIKMFTGWPTFPQVFVNQQLIGGFDDTVKELNQGSLFNELKNKN